MSAIPGTVIQAWEDREGPVVFTTVNLDGIPNAIYATCVSTYKNEMIVVADNYFSKTRENILNGSKGSILFITKEGKSYQVKGEIEYFKEGPVFDEMKKWNPEQHPGHTAAALKIETIYSGADKIL